MNKALRLPVIWQTMLFAFLFVVTGYLYYGAVVTVAVYCAPITMQNSTADTPPLHRGPDAEGALHHVLAPHSLTIVCAGCLRKFALNSTDHQHLIRTTSHHLVTSLHSEVCDLLQSVTKPRLTRGSALGCWCC
ncbi:TPA: hypothetical protein ACH3X2_012090 [Trebouxia sp. C0005]